VIASASSVSTFAAISPTRCPNWTRAFDDGLIEFQDSHASWSRPAGRPFLRNLCMPFDEHLPTPQQQRKSQVLSDRLTPCEKV
jgi:hypothetical protein